MNDIEKEKLAEELKQARRRVAELETALADKNKTPPVDYGTFKSFFESATDSFSIWDSNLKLVYLNDATLTKYYPPGTKGTDVIGQHFTELVPGSKESGRYEKYLNVLNTGTPFYIDEFTSHPRFGDMYLAIRVFKIENGLGIITIDNTGQKRMEDELREGQQRLKALIENGPDIILSYDINGKFLSVNKRAEEILGYTQREMLGKTFAETGLFTAELLAKMPARLKAYKKSEASEAAEYELIAKNGSHVFVEIRDVPIVRRDTIEIISIARDVTKRKRTEEALKQREEKFRIIFDTIADGISIIDLTTGNLIDTNEAALRMFNFTRKDVIGHPAYELIAEKDREKALIDLQKTLESGRSGLLQWCLLGKDSAEYDCEATSAVIRDSAGKPAYLVNVMRDITERKRREKELIDYRDNLKRMVNVRTAELEQSNAELEAEMAESRRIDEALRDSEEKYRSLAEQSVQGIIILQGDRVVFVNQALSQINGYSIEELLAMSSEQVANIGRDDCRALIAKRIVDRTQGEPLPEQSEWRIIRKDGMERWLESRAKRITFNGKPALQSVILDITERKQMEEALKESEAKYRTLVEQSDQGICIIQNGRIVFANKAQAKIEGYSLKELYAMSYDEVLRMVHPDDRKECVNRIKTRLEGKRLMPKHECRIMRKDDTEIWTQSFSKLILYRGQPAIQIMTADITERKQWEDKLQKSKDELRFYLRQLNQAQEEERKRIARELHDETIQEIVALSRQLDKLIDKKIGPEEERRESRQLIEDAQHKVDAILKGIRRFTLDLRPSILDDLGLVPALEWLATDISEQFKIPINISIRGKEQQIASDAALVMFRIAQESLRNACSHAGATYIQVDLKYCSQSVTLSITDNGQGFDLPEDRASLIRRGKLGVAGMYERAQLIGANLSIKSKSNKGTAVTLEVNIK